ncbi:MAG: CarD family transcriptional regulator [Acetatifactor sp.]|nr:CarD family transcriptional regulator [Acetatifactor sp.]
MFEIGEHVVCGSKGVCVVENITTLDISGVDKKRKYYILKPKYQAGSTVYVPVDSPKESMRRVLSREEAQQLIDAIPKLPLIDIANDKLSEQTYKECMRTNSCEEWVRIIKTIYLRKQKRIQAGRKVTAVDAKYFHLAEESLYGELAVALGLNREDVEAYITGEIDKKAEKSPLQTQ